LTDCCPTTITKDYCPGGNQECIQGNLGCCQSGFDIYCKTSEGTWCCTSEYPICGSGKKCLSGSCSCAGCNPNPCEFEGCGNTCETCCESYTPLVCKGGATCVGSGVEGTKNA